MEATWLAANNHPEPNIAPQADKGEIGQGQLFFKLTRLSNAGLTVMRSVNGHGDALASMRGGNRFPGPLAVDQAQQVQRVRILQRRR